MSEEQPKNPLHGITLQQIVTSLFERYGWDELGRRIDIRCFKSNPSMQSSLKFLRKTPWARKKVEDLYISTQLIVAQEKEREPRTYMGMKKMKD